MKRMKLSELTGNEILAQSLMTWDYQIILPEGAVLKKEYIDKIEEMGILEVYVKEDEANEIVILKNDIEKTIRSKVKSILERHTYQNNKELQGLTQAADEIITNILDEKEVVEKVFDIKERSADIYEPVSYTHLDVYKRQTLYRVVQECLLNIKKHSQATRVLFHCKKTEQKYEILIQDNGKGFTKEEAEDKANSHFGLALIHEGVNLLNGTIHVLSLIHI